MTQRSLDGLVAFLTCLFPYLLDTEALAYLDAAELDPLVAALIIINRHGMRQFDSCSGTTVAAVETALRCAALVAEHPDPQLLMVGWKAISGLGLVEFLSDTDADIIRLIQTGRGDLELQESWELNAGRLECLVPICKELPPIWAAMKRMLLATIHGFYLKALRSLPSDQLTHKYHRNILLGGYCYGPLDPVENIIVNSIWYEQTFPSSKGFRTSIINTSCMWLVAARSMYGLVSFLCARYPRLTPDLALQRLLVAGANLRIADPNLFDKPSDQELDWSESPQIGSGVDTTFI
ncbi:hypothetical protein C2845_PM03G37200 [Panicum miliaceum]|uniref:PIR2-like helical domain-containing protein n=1 Tax=Panicum miliaceum TaxID=4540 RepID=A0A3L6TC23_PANMI|nr:hypothetical protein C2845_PM03G37200 [Panicum miliaceum]